MEGNFDFAEDPTAMDVIQQAAKRVHPKYERFVELPDLTQEAYLMVATRDDLQESVNGEDYGYLQHRLEMDLVDHCEMAFLVPRNSGSNPVEGKFPEVQRPNHSAIAFEGRWGAPDAEGNRHREQAHYSYEELMEKEAEREAAGLLPSVVIIETASNDYSRESVESLLPAIWDESYLYGLPIRADAPDPDMPRGSVNKAHGNNLAAYIADIKFGWAKTPLTLKERRALFLAYGCGWTQEQIAFNQEASQQAISARIDTAIGKIAARLNGGYYYDPEAT